MILENVTYNGLDVKVTDGKSNLTTASTDAAGRVITVVDAKQGKTTYKYGPFDTLVSVVDPVGQTASGHARTTDFDDYGHVTTVSSPDRGTEHFTSSAFGLTTNLSADGVSRDYTYDLLGRPLLLVSGDGTTKWGVCRSLTEVALDHLSAETARRREQGALCAEGPRGCSTERRRRVPYDPRDEAQKVP